MWPFQGLVLQKKVKYSLNDHSFSLGFGSIVVKYLGFKVRHTLDPVLAPAVYQMCDLEQIILFSLSQVTCKMDILAVSTS